MTNKLPEGWEKKDYLSAGFLGYFDRRDGAGLFFSVARTCWRGYGPNLHDGLENLGDDPIAAMQALNEKYPLEVPDGE